MRRTHASEHGYPSSVQLLVVVKQQNAISHLSINIGGRHPDAAISATSEKLCWAPRWHPNEACEYQSQVLRCPVRLRFQSTAILQVMFRQGHLQPSIDTGRAWTPMNFATRFALGFKPWLLVLCL